MQDNLIPITNALFSVTDKSGLASFATGLLECNAAMTIIASGGTASMLNSHALSFKALDKHTGFPECFDGRVKTLHPKVMGGILMRRGQDEMEAAGVGIDPIELVVCNLYDFAGALKNKDLAIDQLIESMDIGGSALIRAAVKNFRSTLIIVDPADYPAVLAEVKVNKGSVSLETRRKMAVKAIQLSAKYEALLADELSKRLVKESHHSINLSQGKQLRYGENPSQQAWVYKFSNDGGIANAEILSGKELSYNNYEDATVAYQSVEELRKMGSTYAVSIVKHGNICGFSTGRLLAEAFNDAWDCDSKSAFGGVIASAAPVTDELIEPLKGKFVEIVIAPDFSPSFVKWARLSKPNMRLLALPPGSPPSLFYKAIGGGMLVQSGRETLFPKGIQGLFQKTEGKAGIVTKKMPEGISQQLFLFSVAAVNYVKSNAIAIAREKAPGCYQVLAIGGGQPNRVDCLQRLAIPKALEKLKEENTSNPNYDPSEDLSKCVMASDGFFPFDDSVSFAAKHGIRYCIQPGGSARDCEVIRKADEMDMCMIFTGERYFYH